VDDRERRRYRPRVTTTVRLEPMTPDQYHAYRATAEEDYAEAIRDSGTMGAEEARAKSAADYASLLPAGLDTPGQHLFTVYDDAEPVGMLWLEFTDHSQGTTAFVYDVSVHEDLRRRGYGRAIMLAAEAECRARGAVSIGLNVFGPNVAARRLYESLGFEVTSTQMKRML
jgi:ribosomal protein S18 acetylase RimI-like enzyme